MLERVFARRTGEQTPAQLPVCNLSRRIPSLVAATIFAVATSGWAAPAVRDDAARLADTSTGDDWAGYGRTYGEQHFSPLTEINAANVQRLGLAWSVDLAAGNTATVPLAVDGILYFSTGLNLVHAVDAATGKRLWTYDPHLVEHAGWKLRVGWGARGIGYWQGKLYLGTRDGRLIAVDAKSGKEAWSVRTVAKDDGRYITGAPRAFDGKVIVGHAGADTSDVRGYVTAYDAKTGRQL